MCAADGLAACSSTPSPDIRYASEGGLDLDRRAMALREVKALQNMGARVWCVPFARNASGINIRGNANTWWGKAAGVYDRGRKPVVGAVMAFAGTSGMSMGHVAVVSEVVSERRLKIDHANWNRNKVSLGMMVEDISPRNDWSSVRVESNPGSFGKPYPINGFIYPNQDS